MLYLSIGDDASGCTAQDTSSSLGCIWRIDVSALPGAGAGPPPKSTIIPAGNPYAGPTDNARLVWCHGLRNPFRFHIDPVTGFIYVADVGAGLWEEASEVTTGGQNLGWPWLEGPVPGFSCPGTQPASLAPIATWSHATGAQSIMSVGRYRNPAFGAFNFGAAYEGDYFYLDYYLGAIRRLVFNGSTWSTPPAVPGQPNTNDWATGFNMVSDALTGADGAIYYVQQFGPGFSGPGSLRRIRKAPNAVLMITSGNPQPGNAGRLLDDPLVARVTTPGGAPIAGVAVHFAPIVGGGTMNPAIAVTDGQGYAQSSYTLASSFTGDPVITATSLGAPGVNFAAVWRGIVVTWVPSSSFFSLVVRHSETASPFTVCAGPTPPSPYASTPWGILWTSVLAPVPQLQCIDGLGLLGPPDPTYQTGGATPTYTLTIPNFPPLGGASLVLQAYAIDSTLFPADAGIMISNAPVVIFN